MKFNYILGGSILFKPLDYITVVGGVREKFVGSNFRLGLGIYHRDVEG
jgi:hypothetical protein